MNKISDTTWNEVWQRQMDLVVSEREDAAYWDKRARKKTVTSDNYAQELLRRIALSSDESVLDIGCGNGSVTIPLARRVHHVTALDISPFALKSMQQEALQVGITNITPLTGDFHSLYSGGQIKSHDIVIASRSLPMGDLKQSLAIMNALANRSCYFTWTAGENEFLKNICEITGKKYSPFPEYPIMLNLLYTMGIQANLELFSTEGSYNYASLEEAVNEAVQRYTISREEVNEELTEYIKNQLITDHGQCCRVTKSEWALIWWDVNLE